MLKFGIVTENSEPGFARVKFEAEGIVSAPLQVLCFKAFIDKFSNPPDINAQVACIMDENLEYGVILGELPNKQDKPDSGEAVGKDRKKYADGTLIEYDRTTKTYTIDSKGPVKIKSLVTVDITAPVVNVTGNLVVSGSIAAAAITATGAGGTVTAANVVASGDVTAAGKSLKLHVHGGVQPGGGTTLPPT